LFLSSLFFVSCHLYSPYIHIYLAVEFAPAGDVLPMNTPSGDVSVQVSALRDAQAALRPESKRCALQRQLLQSG
jgi:hypothetical protein